MEHINITISENRQKAHLQPDAGYMLRRGINEQVYSDATVQNKKKELRLWKAVEISFEP